ncbi:hypothetical protein Swit_4460 [Rhizorhabdus wittichii RW1]|uniref:Peptidase S74 domain-containing protein n=1 Tax=Rhizorhabdus wittichii (strain DSM 6014 / CCUG 31198 / JCM 15750 / NBRC 105917 / EY 4224 / RW1) TaxID=392499 RepID=A0A9J9HFM8_RHIWR|nr:hypothetical protein Swit_4460 [Rhizorhabdus wittichii RW1]
MGISSGSKSKSGPAKYTEPYIRQGLYDVQSAYNQQQPRLNALGDVASDAFMRNAGAAYSTNPYVSNAQAAARTISNGYFLDQNSGQATYNRLQGVQSDPSLGVFQNIANGAGNNPATHYASNVAGGGFLNNQPSASLYSTVMGDDYLKGNPYLDSIVAQTNADVSKQANRMFGARGMGTGIGSAFADVLSKNLANNESQLRYQNFNDSANRQLQAAGQSDNIWNSERARMDAATGLLSSDYNADQGRRLAAAQALGNQFGQQQDRTLEAAKAGDAARSEQIAQMLQALSLTDQLSNAQYAGYGPTTDLLKAGAAIPLMGMDSYQQALANLTNATNSSTSKGPGIAYNVWSNAASSLSDRRTKTNIEKVGELDDGLGIYDFDYVDLDHGAGRQRGVMADEVAILRPWALGPRTADGFATVDYKKL